MLAGFEQLNGGDVQLEGTSIAHLPPNQRPVNLMFQSYALFPHMTVAQNIAYGLEMDKLPKAQIKDSVDEILQVIQLGHLAKRKPDQLSGGNASVLLWRGLWSNDLRFCYWMNRLAHWTRNCAVKCSWSSNDYKLSLGSLLL